MPRLKRCVCVCNLKRKSIWPFCSRGKKKPKKKPTSKRSSEEFDFQPSQTMVYKSCTVLSAFTNLNTSDKLRHEKCTGFLCSGLLSPLLGSDTQKLTTSIHFTDHTSTWTIHCSTALCLVALFRRWHPTEKSNTKSFWDLFPAHSSFWEKFTAYVNAPDFLCQPALWTNSAFFLSCCKQNYFALIKCHNI